MTVIVVPDSNVVANAGAAGVSTQSGCQRTHGGSAG